MKTISRNLLLVAMAWAALACETAQADPPFEMKVYERFKHDTIPHLKLSNAGFFEAFDAVRVLWEKSHPDMPFLFGVGCFHPVRFAETAPGKAEPQTLGVTLDVKNVPYLVALRMIADICGYKLNETSGTLKLIGLTGINEDWGDGVYPVTPKVLKALGLNTKSSKKDVTSALKRFGIEFSREHYDASISEDGKAICIRNLDDQLAHFRTILFLLEKGFKITK
ncbi:MAG: hypothetical protein WCV00_20930 [Verrucomicrobiia bacterium]|jgi:hypothetical protein